MSAPFSIKIAGVDRSAYLGSVQEQQVKFSSILGQRGTCSFTLYLPDSGTVPLVIGQLVQLYGPPEGILGTVTCVWAGTVDSWVTTAPGGGSGSVEEYRITVDVTCASLEQILDRRMTDVDAFRNMTDGAIVTALYDKYLAAGSPEMAIEGITLGTLDTNTTFPTYVTNYQTLSSVLNDLGTQSDCYWYIDVTTLKLEFLATSALATAPFEIWDLALNLLARPIRDPNAGAGMAAGGLAREFSDNWTRQDFRDRQWVRLAYAAFAPQVDTFVATGIDGQAFTLSKPVGQMNSVTESLGTVAASAFLDFNGHPSATATISPGDTVTIGTITYTWVTTLDNTQPNQILLIAGAENETAAAYLAAAINNSGPSGSAYSSPTAANPFAFADTSTFPLVDGSGNLNLPVSAMVPGSTGNTIPVASTGVLTWSDTAGGSPASTLAGGVDSTSTPNSASTAQLGTVGAVADYYYEYGFTDLTMAATYAPASGTIIVVTYFPIGSDVIGVQDSAVIAARAAAENNSGIYEILTDESSQTNPDLGLAQAQALLDAYKALQELVYVEIRQQGLLVGQIATVKMTTPYINGTFLINEIQGYSVPGDPYPRYQIELLSTARIGTWLQLWQLLATTGASGGSGGGGGGGGGSAPPDTNVTIDGTQVAYEYGSPEVSENALQTTSDLKGDHLSLRMFGAKGDTQTSFASVTSGSNIATLLSGTFAAGDVGKRFIMYGAGLSSERVTYLSNANAGSYGSTDSYVVVELGTPNGAFAYFDTLGVATSVKFGANCSLNGVTYEIYGSISSSFGTETLVHGPVALAPQAASDLYSESPPNYRYYRVKIKSTTSGQSGQFFFSVVCLGYVFGATITGVTSPTTATLSANAGQTLSGSQCYWGTDDTAAIIAAIGFCAGLVSPGTADGGYSLYAPEGRYLLSDPIRQAPEVTVKGQTGSAVIFYLDAEAFPSNTAAWGMSGTFASDSLEAFFTRLEDIRIDCCHIPGSVGVFADALQENSGLYRCTLINWTSFGLQLSSSGDPYGDVNFIVQDPWIYPSPTVIGADACRGIVGVDCQDVTLIRGTVLAQGGYICGYGICVEMTNGGIVAVGTLHFESARIGLHFNTGSFGNTSGAVITTQSFVETAVTIDVSNPITLGPIENAGANAITDNISGANYTDYFTSPYVATALPMRIRGNDSGPDLLQLIPGNFLGGPPSMRWNRRGNLLQDGGTPGNPNVIGLLTGVNFGGPTQGGWIGINAESTGYPNWVPTSGWIFSVAADNETLELIGLDGQAPTDVPSNGATVQVGTLGTLPSGLTAGVSYFVINATATSFQLSATSGGSAISVSGGAGVFYVSSSLLAVFIRTAAQAFEIRLGAVPNDQGTDPGVSYLHVDANGVLTPQVQFGTTSGIGALLWGNSEGTYQARWQQGTSEQGVIVFQNSTDSGSSWTDVFMINLTAGNIFFSNGADFASGSPYGSGLYWGTGSPEGVVSAQPGSVYFDFNGALWVKVSGSTATVWAQAVLLLNVLSGSQPVKTDSGGNLITGKINLSTGSGENDVTGVTQVSNGGTGVSSLAANTFLVGGSSVGSLPYGLTGSFYGVQDGDYSFNAPVIVSFTSTSITYVTDVVGSSADAVTSVDFVHSSTTTSSFLTGASVNTASQAIVVSVGTATCQVPALDGGHTVTKGLVET
jgi:hypothetical protein